MQKNYAYKQANKNFPLPKKEVDKKNKRIASIILCLLMVIWTLGAVCGFVSLGRQVFIPNKASAVVLTDSIDGVYQGSALPVATFSDWVHESENKLFVSHERKSLTNNVDGAYNGIKGTFTANVNRPGEWGSYSLIVPLKALFSDNARLDYNFMFYAYISDFADSSSNDGRVRAQLYSDLDTSLDSYIWDSQFSWIDYGYIDNREIYLPIDLTFIGDSQDFNNYYLQFSFYFFGVDTNFTGENYITFTDLGLYSTYDNLNPITESSLPKWTANYGYIYNSAYNQGINDSSSAFTRGIFNGLTANMTAIYNNENYSVNPSINFYDNGVNIYDFNWDTFNNSFIMSGDSLADGYSFTQTFIFSNPLSFSQVGFYIQASNLPTSSGDISTLRVFVNGFVNNNQNVSYVLNLPQNTTNGFGNTWYRLDLSVIQSQINNYNDTFLLTSITYDGGWVKDGYYNQHIRALENYNSSYMNGYNVGFEDGQFIGEDLKAQIRRQGYNNGLIDGEAVGFNKGVLSANDYSFLGLFGAIVDAPLQALSGLLNFDILGFNMLNFFYSLITLCIIITIVRLILMK